MSMSSAVGMSVAPGPGATSGAAPGVGAEKRTHLDSNDPDEPELKRRAQNRAAQRAFRERKERHLRDLETRLAELEVESRSWKSTNLALRNQLSLLEEELHHYRQRARQQQPISHGVPPHIPPSSASSARTAVSQPPAAPRPHSIVKHQLPTPPGINREPNNGSVGSTPTAGITPASPPSVAGEEFCQQLSMACGTRDRPLPAVSPPQVTGYDPAAPPQIAAEITGWQMPQDLLGLPGKLPPSANVNGQSPSASSSASQLHRDPNDNLYIGDLVNGDYGMFDPLDDILGWDSAIGMTSTTLSPLDGVVDSVGLDALEVPSLGAASTSSPSTQAQALLPMLPDQLTRNSPDIHSPGNLRPAPSQPPSLAHSSPMSSVHTPGSVAGSVASSSHGDSKDDQVSSSATRFVSCSDVWDRLCAHPRFGEIDINSMCNELRTKAKCSDSGVVMTERDLDRVLANY